MKTNQYARKFFAGALCLVMLLSMTVIPALAAPEEETPQAPAVEAPAKEEAPVVDEAPAKEEAPVVDDAPAKEEAPVVDDAPAKEETPAEDEAPAKEETPVEEPTVTDAAQEETPAEEETPVEEPTATDAAEDETPAESEAPAEEPTATASAKPSRAPGARASQEPEAEPSDADTPEEPENVDEPQEAAADEPADLGATLFSAGEDNGFSFDWSQEEVLDSGWDSKHGVVKTSRGYYLYFETGEWGSASLGVYTPDNPWNASYNFTTTAGDPGHLVDSMSGNALWDNEDIEVNYYTQGGRRYTEAFIPAEVMPEGDFTLKCNTASFDFTAAAARDAEGGEASPTPEPVYEGIVIDGDFDDWAAVPSYEIDDGRGYSTVDHVSVVWDGDTVYILLSAEGDGAGNGNWTSVTGAGTHGNGQYAITTDLGRTLLVQPVVDASGNPAVAGIDGGKAAVNNKEWTGAPHLWELSIPASELPEYLETINFGFYMSEPTVTGIVDMQGGQNGVDPFGADVEIDGKYNDWVGYPHTLIQYDHQGIQHHEVDGEAALWSDDGYLYGHVVTEHPDHLDEKGSEYLAAISIAFNGDREHKDTPDKGNFYPRILAIDDQGNVTDFYKTVNEGHQLPNGTHTFYIFDTRTDPIKQFGHTDENGVWHDPTAAELIENAFGQMKVTVNGEKDDMEFYLDLAKVADYIGQDGDTAFKTIEAQFGRIGQQWVTTAGTPTGPIVGVALAVGAVGAPACYAAVKKRRKREDDTAGEAK